MFRYMALLGGFTLAYAAAGTQVSLAQTPITLTQEFFANLDGLEEVPAISSEATGRFTAELLAEDGVVAYELSYSGLESAVTQAHIVLVARPAAITVVRAFGQERAEDTVLHVKHRHVLVQRDVEPRAWRALQEGLELHDVEVVRGGHPFQPVISDIVIGGKRVRDVQREVTAPSLAGEPLQVVVVADKITVSVAR